jgi:magnesium transporter
VSAADYNEAVNAGADPGEDLEAALERVRALLAHDDEAGLVAFLSDLHPKDIADIVAELDESERVYVFNLLEPEVVSEALAEMESDEHPEDILAQLEPGRIAEVVQELADDDAADLIGELDPDDQARVLAAVPAEEAGELRELMRYDEESAGGIMTTELVALSVNKTAAEAIADVREQAREIGGELFVVFVVDDNYRLVGTLTLQELVVAEPDTPLSSLVEEPAATVSPEEDQEEVTRIISRYNLPAVAVVRGDGVLLGQVTWDDVIDVLEEEQTEDVLRMGGVSSEEELRASWYEAVPSRFTWLFINLFTAVLAGGVVVLFNATIEKYVLLAAIMPVIAGMGGNGGTQSLAVTVRLLAVTREVSERRWSVVGKEVLIGLANGAALGLITGLFCFFWKGSAMLGVVVLLAMWGNLVIAGLFGALVPILLEKFGADPAVASSIFVTTFTDVGGFFLLLGLASKLLL